MKEESIISPELTAHLVERWWTTRGPANGFIIESIDSLDELYAPIIRYANKGNNEWVLIKGPRPELITPIIPQIVVYPIKELIEEADSIDISI